MHKPHWLKFALRNWSLDDAETALRNGVLTQRQFDKFLFVWSWSCPRYTGNVGLLHDRYCLAHGETAYHARINRVRSAIGLDAI